MYQTIIDTIKYAVFSYDSHKQYLFNNKHIRLHINAVSIVIYQHYKLGEIHTTINNDGTSMYSIRVRRKVPQYVPLIARKYSKLIEGNSLLAISYSSQGIILDYTITTAHSEHIIAPVNYLNKAMILTMHRALSGYFKSIKHTPIIGSSHDYVLEQLKIMESHFIDIFNSTVTYTTERTMNNIVDTLHD